MAADHAHPFDPGGVERARAAQLTDEQAQRLSDVLALVGDPVRARVICALLAVDELCVGDVALAADVNHDAASYALRTLRTAGLVQRRREGRLNYYRLTDHDTQPTLRSALAAVLDLSDSGPLPEWPRRLRPHVAERTPRPRAVAVATLDRTPTDTEVRMAIRQMLKSHEDQLNVDALSNAIEALIDCAAHCNICADACLEEDMDMTRCIRACLDCADICQATASVIARAGASGAPWLELVRVCADACTNCAEECEKHDDMTHCQQCAEACRRCEQACRELLEAAS